MTLSRWPLTVISSVAFAGLLLSTWHLAAQTRGGAPPRPSPGSGTYKAVMEMDAGLPDHTIYRPEDMSALNGATLPLVIWGNGACANAGNSFSNFLTDISSYGFVAIALGPITERNAAGPAPPAAAGHLDRQSSNPAIQPSFPATCRPRRPTRRRCSTPSNGPPPRMIAQAVNTTSTSIPRKLRSWVNRAAAFRPSKSLPTRA